MATVYSKTGEYYMAILEIDSIELLMLANNIDIDQKLLVEIEEFFDEHFDYNN